MGSISQEDLAIVKELYYEQELSMIKVGQKLGVSIDAVCYFMRKNGLSRRSFSEDNNLRFKRKIPSFKIAKMRTRDEKRLKDLGVVLYWGEGYKTNKSSGVDFANSDPEMISIFVSFLRRICGVDERRLRVLLYCYSNQNVDSLKKFWSRKTSIPISQFTKPYIKKNNGTERSGLMKYGMVHIRYYDKKLLNTIMAWLEEIKSKYASVVERSITRDCKSRAL